MPVFSDKYSVIIPLFNSKDSLPSIVHDFKTILLERGYHAELILVDDASDNKTRMLTEKIANENNFITAVFLKKNFGQLAATTCGIQHANGNIIITMDDDLQYPMKEVLKLISRYYESGKKIIFGYPLKRMQGFRHKLMVRLGMWLFDYILLPRYRKINFYTSFRIFDRSYFWGEDNQIIKRHLFYVWEIPVHEMDSVPVEHHPRKSGKSAYTFFKKLKTLRPVLWFALYRFSSLMIFPLFTALILWLIFSTEHGPATAILTVAFLGSIISMTIFKLLLFKEKIVRYDVHKIVCHNFS